MWYVAGRLFKKNNEWRFGLAKPSQSKLPYITNNINSSAMHACSYNGCGLYAVDINARKLTKIKDHRYEKDSNSPEDNNVNIRPDCVDLTQEMACDIVAAMRQDITFLAF